MDIISKYRKLYIETARDYLKQIQEKVFLLSGDRSKDEIEKDEADLYNISNFRQQRDHEQEYRKDLQGKNR